VSLGVDHGELVSLAEKYYDSMSLTHEYEIPALKKCRFTGSEVITLFYHFTMYPLPVTLAN